MFIIISIIIIGFFSFAFLFPFFYISELILSFLPYIVGISLLGLIFSFVKFKKIKAYMNIKKTLLSIIIVFFGILFFVSSKKFNNFYNGQSFKTGGLDSGYVKILFGNIHKYNQNWTGIKNLIQKNNPDLIMFVEFSEQHYDALKDFLKTNYPYINSTTWSKKFIGSMVFSKYKINNRADNFYQGMWRYGYFSIKLNNQDVYFYLIHDSSPDSYKHFLMRNNQLSLFIKDFHIQGKNRNNDNIVVVGDFNLTPRSYYYSKLESDFSGKIYDITRNFPILFTRKMFDLPMLLAHIDHIRINSGMKYLDLNSVIIPGSDHKGFIVKLKMNN